MKKYTVIYADPPWKYDNHANGINPETHYPTMTIEEIAAFGVYSPTKFIRAMRCA